MADRFPIIIESTEQQIQELSAGDGLDLTKSGVVNANYVHSAGVNAGVVTATSFIGDGSQITNIPAGGGSLEATASGTLADGSKVIVNADGTVSVVAQTETTQGGAVSETVFESGSTASVSSAYDSANGKVVIAYYDGGNTDKGTAVVGTVSGTSISFGTPVVFDSSSIYHIQIAFDSTNNKVVISYMNGATWYGYAIVGTVSGTSISFGSPSSSFGTTSSIDNTSITYDSANNKVVITYRDAGNSSYGTAIVGTVSGTSISLGTPVVFNSGDTRYTSATFDSTNNKVVIAYKDGGNSGYGTAIVGTVSGTSISFGSEVVFESANTDYISATYDSANNKVVIAYMDNGNSSYGTAVVGTVSGTSISFGTPVVFESAGTYQISTTYDSTNQKVVIAYRDNGNSNYGTAVVGTVSGTSISLGSPVVFNSNASYWPSAVHDSTNGKVVIAYRDNGNSGYGTAAVFVESGLSIPQIGSAAVFESAQSNYIRAVYDSTNNKVVVAYQDYGNSQYGTAVVGTVSGTSISFGSSVVFESAPTYYLGSTYTTNGKVVIAYMDNGNSNYGTAIVGTVSGTSISFGSPVVFESAQTQEISAVYDPTNDKVVIAYSDYGNTQKGTAIVGTVSGTSISFGSPVVFQSSLTNAISSIYDSTNNKVVLAYNDQNNSYYGKAVVGTVSGTSISFGSVVTFESAHSNYFSLVYNSTNQKVVIAYRDVDNSNYGTAIVGTVSGTSISFGSPVVFESTNSEYISATYDPNRNEVVISYRDNGNSSYGTSIVGTVSGTSISFGTPFVFESASTDYISSVYDSTNQKVAIAYRDNGNSNYGTAVVFSPITIASNLTSENFIGISDGVYTNGQTATIQIAGSVDDAQSSLTPGQQYYVQNDGTLSETADTPSVLAGTAVAATKLMIG